MGFFKHSNIFENVKNFRVFRSKARRDRECKQMNVKYTGNWTMCYSFSYSYFKNKNGCKYMNTNHLNLKMKQ